MQVSQDGKVSLLVVDDSAVVRQRLSLLLQEQPQLRVVGQAATAVEAISLFELHHPRAVLLDIHLPDFSGLEVLRWIRRADPSCAVVVLTSFSGLEFGEVCLREGAQFFFDKSREFEAAVETVGRLCPGTGGSLPRAESETDRGLVGK